MKPLKRKLDTVTIDGETGPLEGFPPTGWAVPGWFDQENMIRWRYNEMIVRALRAETESKENEITKE